MPTLGVPEWTIWSVQVFIRFILPESIENLKQKEKYLHHLHEGIIFIAVNF